MEKSTNKTEMIRALSDVPGRVVTYVVQSEEKYVNMIDKDKYLKRLNAFPKRNPQLGDGDILFRDIMQVHWDFANEIEQLKKSDKTLAQSK